MQDKKESKVGKRLSEATTRRVVILVLAMLFSVPFFTVNTYVIEPNSYDYGLSLVRELGPETEQGKSVFLDTVDIQKSLDTTPLIFLYIDPNTTYSKETSDTSKILIWENPLVNISNMRENEQEYIQLETGENSEALYYAIYDLRSVVYLQAVLGIANTFLVCIILGAGAMIFSKITNDLVILPIENMIEKINKITQDPLKAHYEEEDKLLLEELQMQERIEAGEVPDKNNSNTQGGPMETVVLEQTLSKIGALLAIGFGEAGSMIIAQNM